jgi:hydroxymethylglutaryl-CoA reductase
MAMAEDLNSHTKELFRGFSKLNRRERLQRLVSMGALSADDVKFLMADKGLSTSLAENFIENVIGYFQLPLGVAANFVIDKKAYVIPMAVEETSIIAAASKTAKWVRDCGELSTEIVGDQIIGQIQIARVNDYDHLQNKIEIHKKEWIDLANQDVAQGLHRRGGGVSDLFVRKIDRGDGKDMAVIHVLVNTCDAMGANIVNQVCEFLRYPIEQVTNEAVTMCILSNLVDSKVTRAKAVLRGLESDLMDRIQEASLFAQRDSYRACTNNKGVLNGIDPILIATGNDWRAVEAGVHAYATRDGQYRSVTRWAREGDELVGTFEAPLILGVVGGVTKLHPMAQMSLKMLGVESANELSRVCAAVGLVQNLGALRALTTVGIIEGHMKLHIKNLTLGAGADDHEIPIVQKKLEEILSLTKRITLSHAVEVLKELRAGRAANSVAENAAMVGPQT